MTKQWYTMTASTGPIDSFNDELTEVVAREIAQAVGLRHVYTGNVRDRAGSATRCAGCGAPLIERDGFEVTANRLARGCCPSCGRALAGVFSA